MHNPLGTGQGFPASLNTATITVRAASAIAVTFASMALGACEASENPTPGHQLREACALVDEVTAATCFGFRREMGLQSGRKDLLLVA